MQGREDITKFIQEFKGDHHRYIMDYLMEEVLKIQTDDSIEDLFKTSILRAIFELHCATLFWAETIVR